jgi:hypothetical protein
MNSLIWCWCACDPCHPLGVSRRVSRATGCSAASRQASPLLNLLPSPNPNRALPCHACAPGFRVLTGVARGTCLRPLAAETSNVSFHDWKRQSRARARGDARTRVSWRARSGRPFAARCVRAALALGTPCALAWRTARRSRTVTSKA